MSMNRSIKQDYSSRGLTCDSRDPPAKRMAKEMDIEECNEQENYV